jgi:hypothetical protein
MATRIFIPIICYNQTVNVFYMMKIIELIILLKQNNYDITIEPIGFESLIPRARNYAAAKMLDNKENTHLLFIDTDIVFNPQDVIKLLQADKDVITGIYPKKFLNPESASYPVSFCINGQIKITNNDKIFEADLVPTGFMLIKRNVFEKIIQLNSNISYKNNINGYKTETNIFYNFFPIHIESITNHLLSEDFAFCKLVQQSGLKVYCHSDITLTHIGYHSYTGNLDEFLQTIKN